MIEKTLDVPAIACGHCKSAIEGAVGQLAGVDAVSVDIESKRVTVRYDAATVQQDAVVAAIEDAGYEVPRRRRPPAARRAAPDRRSPRCRQSHNQTKGEEAGSDEYPGRAATGRRHGMCHVRRPGREGAEGDARRRERRRELRHRDGDGELRAVGDRPRRSAPGRRGGGLRGPRGRRRLGRGRRRGRTRGGPRTRAPQAAREGGREPRGGCRADAARLLPAVLPHHGAALDRHVRPRDADPVLGRVAVLPRRLGGRSTPHHRHEHPGRRRYVRRLLLLGRGHLPAVRLRARGRGRLRGRGLLRDGRDHHRPAPARPLSRDAGPRARRRRP